MALETGTSINDLVITNPTSTDPKSQGDDHIRLVKAAEKHDINGFTKGVLMYVADTGSATAHVLTPTTALTAYGPGQGLYYAPANANSSGACTVNVSGLGAKSIKTNAGDDPTANSIAAGKLIWLMYDGTNFVLMGGSAYLSKTGNQTFTGNLTLTGNQTVSGTFGATGNATFGGTLAVTGASTFTGDLSGAGADKKANKAGEVYGAGTHDFSAGASVLVPTATVGGQAINLTQLTATAFAAALPSQTGNGGKFVTTDGTNASWAQVYPSQTGNAGKFLQTDGTTTSWAASGIANVTTSATSVTLTSTSTLAVMTPTGYGVTVKLQNATSDTPKDGYHAIANKGAYPIRVTDSTDTLLGFVYPGVKCNVALVTASAAGAWAFDNVERVGAAAQLLSTALRNTVLVLDLGSSQEILLGTNATNGISAVVYNRSTNTFGSVTVIRAATIAGSFTACVSAANQLLVTSCTSGSTAFEAVAVSVTGTTISVGTAATATLAANISNFAEFGSGVIAVGAAFVTSYRTATPACEIRAITVTGTTVAIGAATSLSGTSGGGTAGSNFGAPIRASASIVIAASYETTNLYIRPYTVSGTTLTAGTGVTSSGGTKTLRAVAANSNGRWFVIAQDGTNGIYGGVATLSGTTVTYSQAVLTADTGNNYSDAIVVNATKLLYLHQATTGNANILTDTAGTASVGTAITVDGQATKVALYVSGTDVAIQSGTTTYLAHVLDCSGTSPVLSRTITTGGSNVEAPAFSAANSLLSRSPNALFGTTYARQVWLTAVTQNFDPEVNSGVFNRLPHNNVPGDNTSPGVAYRGRAANEIWIADASTVVTKLECAA